MPGERVDELPGQRLWLAVFQLAFISLMNFMVASFFVLSVKKYVEPRIPSAIVPSSLTKPACRDHEQLRPGVATCVRVRVVNGNIDIVQVVTAFE